MFLIHKTLPQLYN
nr:unnamed protein product [Callosobruchus chinensis]